MQDIGVYLIVLAFKESEQLEVEKIQYYTKIRKNTGIQGRLQKFSWVVKDFSFSSAWAVKGLSNKFTYLKIVLMSYFC